MSGDHNMYQKSKSYLDFECPRCGHCCYVDDDDTSQERVDKTVKSEHEPVAAIQHWCTYCQGHNAHNCQFNTQLPRVHTYTSSHTTPPKREWVGLTDAEINSVRYKRDWTAPWTDTTFARAIEAKLREKNT